MTGCHNPVWGKGLCQAHSPRTPLRKTKLYPNAIAKKQFDGIFNRAERRNNFFMSIWNVRPHTCQICNKNLGPEPLTYMFDHLLEKSKYPHLMWEPENILLVCLECHDKKTRGIVGEKYREKINFAITKFISHERREQEQKE